MSTVCSGTLKHPEGNHQVGVCLFLAGVFGPEYAAAPQPEAELVHPPVPWTLAITRALLLGTGMEQCEVEAEPR